MEANRLSQTEREQRLVQQAEPLPVHEHIRYRFELERQGGKGSVIKDWLLYGGKI